MVGLIPVFTNNGIHDFSSQNGYLKRLYSIFRKRTFSDENGDNESDNINVIQFNK